MKDLEFYKKEIDFQKVKVVFIIIGGFILLMILGVLISIFLELRDIFKVLDNIRQLI